MAAGVPMSAIAVAIAFVVFMTLVIAIMWSRRGS
jgi:hypothetical protein